jgi:hypothetical protein
MARRLKIRALQRKEIDEDKLALAFLMLAKALQEEAAKRGGETSAEAA